MPPASPDGARARRCHDFPRDSRIVKRADFLRVQQQGRRVHTPHFVIIVLPAARQRLGITVTKRVANAVGRNRIKRRAREVFRQHRDLFPAGCEVVLVARKGADDLGFHALRDELRAAAGPLSRARRQRDTRANVRGGEDT